MECGLLLSSPWRVLIHGYQCTLKRGGGSSGKNVLLPAVFKAPIRPDIVNFVHTNVCHQISADSWGPGTSVAQIPRVQGSRTHHSGQGAFGNKVNTAQKWYATCSALAAIEAPELSLVVEGYKKTMEALYASHRMKAAEGYMKNRIQHMGPSITDNEDGVTLLNVSKLNILKLAPGSHVGCFCIWTGNAFCKLDELVTTTSPMHKMLNTDLSRILKILKKNPLKNLTIMLKLTPYAKIILVGKKAARTKKAAAKKKPTGKKPTIEEEKAAAQTSICLSRKGQIILDS
ncbi:hypothetical protein ABFV05_020746 [Capra hircus]